MNSQQIEHCTVSSYFICHVKIDIVNFYKKNINYCKFKWLESRTKLKVVRK